MSSIKVNARFKSSGSPSTGLSPTVSVYNRGNDTIPVSAAAMTEIADGFYEYDFTTFDIMADYLFSFDGTATLADADRYMSAEWSGIDGLAQTLRNRIGSTGTVVKNVGMSEEQFKELAESLVDMVSGVQIEGSETGVKEAILELKKEAEKQIKEAAKKLIEQNKKLSEKVSKPIVNVETQVVEVKSLDTADFDKKMKKSIDFLDGLLADFAEFVGKGVQDLKGMETKSLKQAQADFLKQQLKKLEE